MEQSHFREAKNSSGMSKHFVELKTSFLWSQELTSGPYPEAEGIKMFTRGCLCFSGSLSTFCGVRKGKVESALRCFWALSTIQYYKEHSILKTRSVSVLMWGNVRYQTCWVCQKGLSWVIWGEKGKEKNQHYFQRSDVYYSSPFYVWRIMWI
jgi:hypothetical protein